MQNEDNYYIYQDFVLLVALILKWVEVVRYWLVPTWVIPLD